MSYAYLFKYIIIGDTGNEERELIAFHSRRLETRLVPCLAFCVVCDEWGGRRGRALLIVFVLSRGARPCSLSAFSNRENLIAEITRDEILLFPPLSRSVVYSFPSNTRVIALAFARCYTATDLHPFHAAPSINCYGRRTTLLNLTDRFNFSAAAAINSTSYIVRVRLVIELFVPPLDYALCTPTRTHTHIHTALQIHEMLSDTSDKSLLLERRVYAN